MKRLMTKYSLLLIMLLIGAVFIGLLGMFSAYAGLNQSEENNYKYVIKSVKWTIRSNNICFREEGVYTGSKDNLKCYPRARNWEFFLPYNTIELIEQNDPDHVLPNKYKKESRY
jgi:hypothetical protein